MEALRRHAVPTRFSGWLYDEEARALWDGPRLVHLSPKAFALLGLLIARYPAAVSKGEIQRTLWPSTFVCESNLTKLVREVRVALRDDARESRFVRTIHRYGYAFLGPLETDDISAGSATSDGPFRDRREEDRASRPLSLIPLRASRSPLS